MEGYGWDYDEELLKEFERMIGESIPSYQKRCKDGLECDWKEYVGLTKRYEYCKKCDRKKENV